MAANPCCEAGSRGNGLRIGEQSSGLAVICVSVVRLTANRLRPILAITSFGLLSACRHRSIRLTAARVKAAVPVSVNLSLSVRLSLSYHN